MSIEAMKQALEALEDLQGGCTDSDDGTVEALTIYCPEVIANLRAAIEQAEKPEPVAWVCHGVGEIHDVDYYQEDVNALPFGTLLYAHPPTAPRQEHYDQTSLELCKECGWRAMIPGEGCLTCARQKAKPVAYTYTGIRQDGSTHGPHLVWKPEYMDAMSASKGAVAIPLYAAPRQWVELTDEEVHEGFCHVEYETPNDWNTDPDDWCQQFARYLEAKLKEKNHG